MGRALNDKMVFAAIGSLSLVVIGFLFWLVYLKEASGQVPQAYRILPALNAAFNAAAACCLVAGFAAIRRGARSLHAGLMLTALGLSALFLIGYVMYHSVAGDTKFGGTGLMRPIYFAILISHIALTAVTVPAILTTVYFAATASFERHRRLARWTLPAWLYVSVTGVLIFVMLRAFG